MKKILLMSLILILFGCDSNDNAKAALENDAKIRQGFLDAASQQGAASVDTSKKTYKKSSFYGSEKGN